MKKIKEYQYNLFTEYNINCVLDSVNENILKRYKYRT